MVTTTECLVLRRFDFSETSQIGHLFTRELGRVTVLARGIKRPGPELLGPLDLFARAEVTLRQRRGDMQLLTRYRVITGYRDLRRSRPNLFAAFYVAELLREGTRDLDPHPELFDFTAATLEALESPDINVPAVVFHYELGYLREAGFMPEFQACVRCGRLAPETGPVRFSHAQRGLLCRTCVGGSATPLVTITKSLRQALSDLGGAASPLEAGRLILDPQDREFLRDLFTKLLERELEKELRSAAFLPA